MSEETNPCSVCGSPVVVREFPAERRLGVPRNEVYQKRVCTNPDCQTNGKERALGQTP